MIRRQAYEGLRGGRGGAGGWSGEGRLSSQFLTSVVLRGLLVREGERENGWRQEREWVAARKGMGGGKRENGWRQEREWVAAVQGGLVVHCAC